MLDTTGRGDKTGISYRLRVCGKANGLPHLLTTLDAGLPELCSQASEKLGREGLVCLPGRDGSNVAVPLRRVGVGLRAMLGGNAAHC